MRRAGVNFATSRATVEYDPQQTSISDMMAEVRRTGYDTAGNAKAEFVVDDSARPSGSGTQLEEHLNSLPGVVRVDFNLAMRRVLVEYLADRIDLASIQEAIEAFGYTPSESRAGAEIEADGHSDEYRSLRRKFWVAAILSLPAGDCMGGNRSSCSRATRWRGHATSTVCLRKQQARVAADEFNGIAVETAGQLMAR